MNNRIQSIDLLRGIAMVIMALDHVRDYFHYSVSYFSATDLEQTTVPVFLTRFITHICAPSFCFLAGTSAYFVGLKQDKQSLSIWLIKRGLWLIILEFTVMHFAWYFKLHTNLVHLSVIWSLGASMIFLAAIIHIPAKFAIPFFAAVIAGHNLLDSYQPEPDNLLSQLWMVFHIQGRFQIGSVTFQTVYPIMPWIALMALGYHFGRIYHPSFDPALRKKILLLSGVSLIVAFVILRIPNIYGDLHPWVQQPSAIFSLLSILNVTKYPPSFLFLAITIGPALVFLAFAEKLQGKFSQMLITVGQVPLFFYVIHVYVIHIFALVAVKSFGFEYSDMIFDNWIGAVAASHLKGYGFSLPVVYLIWIILVISLYPVCAWYNSYKKTHQKQWWLSYL